MKLRLVPTLVNPSACFCSLFLFAFLTTPVWANCVTINLSTSCDATAPNPWTTRIGAGPNEPIARTITINNGADLNSGNQSAISISDDSVINVRNGGVVQNASSGPDDDPYYGGNFGSNTIELRRNGQLTVDQGGQVLSLGNRVSSEAVSLFGTRNTIVNNGTIRSTVAAAFWFERGSGQNTIINNATGLMRGGSSGILIGSNSASLDFTNYGRAVGDLALGGRDDTIRLFTGSSLTGQIRGGGGTNRLFLNGSGVGTEEGSFTSTLTGFTTLTKADRGTWVITSPLSGPMAVRVEAGTLGLAGNNADFTGSMTVDAAGTLEAPARNMTPMVINNGLVRFNQTTDGSYQGEISGTGAVEKTNAGLLVLAPAASAGNTYSGGTTITAGTLAIATDSAIGAPTGGLTLNGGTLQYTSAFNLSEERPIAVEAAGGIIDIKGMTTTIVQGISGSGRLTVAGSSGDLVLAGPNRYTGGTTISEGVTLQVGDGNTSGSIMGDVLNAGTLVFSRAAPSSFEFDGMISGTGNVTRESSGSMILTAANTYTGITRVSAGSLYINGNQSGATGNTDVASGATFGGGGTVGGDVYVADGATVSPGPPGPEPGGLTVKGELKLSPASELAFNFGQAKVAGGALNNDLINVEGDLVLDGTLNVQVAPGRTFAPGVYRLINYQSGFTDNGLTAGVLPSPDFFIQTSVANQVNLVNTTGLPLRFWDGADGVRNDGKIHGGDGRWQSTMGNDNWTEGTGQTNAPFSNGAFAMFTGLPGKVSVDDSLGPVTVSGMQFLTDQYLVQGDKLTLIGAQSIVRVGDGTMAGSADIVANITAELTGASALVKSDPGTLILSATNTYTGGTAVNSGSLAVSSNENLGAATGGLDFNGGVLRNRASFMTDRVTTLGAAGGTFSADANTNLTHRGRITGVGGLTKQGGGSLTLMGANVYLGPTNIASGTVVAGAENSLSASSSHTVQLGATLSLGGNNETVGALTNFGTVDTASSAPGTVLTVRGDYSGGGGLIVLNARLDDDSSPTDRLVVEGMAKGHSTLLVRNVQGKGAPTTQGIKLVDVNRVSDGMFSLQGNTLLNGEQAVVAGAYGYRLYKNGVNNNDGDWYLRSALLTDPGGVTDGGGTGSGGDGTGGGDGGPLYQPGVPLYESYANVLQEGFNALPTLRQRLENRRCSEDRQSGADDRASVKNCGGWARVEAAHSDLKPRSSMSKAHYDIRSRRLQAGADFKLKEGPSGALFGGGSLSYVTLSSGVRSVHGDGSISSNGYGFGGSFSWYANSGFYVDTQAQLTWFGSELHSRTAARQLAEGSSGFAYAVSMEAGQKIALGSNWALTPQVQLVYSAVSVANFTDAFGAAVSVDDETRLKGDLGVSADYDQQWVGAGGRLAHLHLYGVVRLYHDFSGASHTEVAGVRFTHEAEPLSGGVGFGGSYRWGSDQYALFSEALVNTHLKDIGNNYNVMGTVGFSAQF